jgi:hypothetical protein
VDAPPQAEITKDSIMIVINNLFLKFIPSPYFELVKCSKPCLQNGCKIITKV